MRKTVLAVALTGLIASTSVIAEEVDTTKQNEVVGLGSGVAVGALAGGPLGAMIGGIVGLLIAEDINNEQRLTLASNQLKQREEQLIALNGEYKRLKEETQVQLVSMDTQIERVLEPLEASIQFETGSYALAPHYQSQLTTLAHSLKRNPDMTVQLSGFADRRGDDTFNQALSEQRVLSVKSYLTSLGVAKEQITTLSFGESKPLYETASREKDFFDRRVVIKLDEGARSMTVAN
ncbi:sortase-associated OmpA-like protein PdsO [Aestuariibacter sp. AA17]|uniref:Sortase-associated OmpA-like protein PdsO n=1 Tax=Fluctibacter corallii TaxID=2984329 RepID=A0ABT3AAQ3_9ALTE|nr:sortase-associated OmpA-like protein PdsO [Aestuariibacter sp. AA17]MCV2885665.1 sortase-associated OmpA-like protein PdsO [Aestuariibacter sp. AA17]